MNEERTGKCLRQVEHIRDDHGDIEIPYRLTKTWLQTNKKGSHTYYNEEPPTAVDT